MTTMSSASLAFLSIRTAIPSSSPEDGQAVLLCQTMHLRDWFPERLGDGPDAANDVLDVVIGRVHESDVRDYCQAEGIAFTRCRPGGLGTALCDGEAVRELLPALVQAGREGARGARVRKRHISGHAVRAALGGSAHTGGGAPVESPARQPGSGSFAERDAGGATGVALADRDADRPALVDTPSIAMFLAGLRTA